MPKPRRRSRARTSNPRKPIQPFSLILQPAELNLLRKLAGKEGTSIGAIVRRAIHTVIADKHPEFARQILESGADTFLSEVAMRLPAGAVTPVKRSAFKNQLIKSLR